MRFRSYQDMFRVILAHISKLPTELDLIVGVPRSGLIPAQMIGSLRNLPVVSLDEFLTGMIPEAGYYSLPATRRLTSVCVRNVLVVDDSINSGRSIDRVRKRIAAARFQTMNIRYAAIFYSKSSERFVDYAFECVPYPRIFQWNLFAHPLLQCACVDIDGVVCDDPTPEQNDDGMHYLEFLKTARPRIIPGQYVISCFVTSRLEKYRNETEAWLLAHGFQFKELVMLDLPNQKERMRRNAYGRYKGEVYKKRPERLFVESEWEQAVEIMRISGKPVLCTDNMRFISPGNDICEGIDRLAYFKDRASVLTEQFAHEQEMRRHAENVVRKWREQASKLQDRESVLTEQFAREQEMRQHAEDVVRKWREQASKLQDRESVLTEQFAREQEMRQHAEDVVRKWREQASKLQGRVSVLTEQFTREQEMRQHAEDVVRKRTEQIDQLMLQLDNERQELMRVVTELSQIKSSYMYRVIKKVGRMKRPTPMPEEPK